MTAAVSSPFIPFATLRAEVLRDPIPLRAAITAAYRRDEITAVRWLLDQVDNSDAASVRAAQQLAGKLVASVREQRTRASGVDALMHEFSLSSEEGVALMCLAEALLRIPDTATADRLIADKISKGDWRKHLGESPSLFVNAATWGLLITGKLVSTSSENGLGSALSKLITKGGEPLIRKGVDLAMRMLGNQFVTGQTIGEAIRNGAANEARGYRYSYDMLGEAALTGADADKYFASYEAAIHAIGKASNGRGIKDGPGISVKLSALHPRYSRGQRARVLAELLPRLRQLVLLAKRYDIGLNIDAEEADRLELSLDLMEAMAYDPELAGFDGIGFVVQAYQKRCPFVIDYLVGLARRSGRKFMVRLVKGAYWDAEIKRAQVDGMPGYPVYTRKVYTDVSYLVCAQRLLAATDVIYPQFATHNAQTLSTIHTWARRDGIDDYEFQCLHGMGESLYDQVVGKDKLGKACRIYAPVGTHETLLAYLVRRLLENGANSSFVNQIVDEAIPVASLTRDPVALAREQGGLPHTGIALPLDMFGPRRRNSAGFDLSNEEVLRELADGLAGAGAKAVISAQVPVHGAPASEAETGIETKVETKLETEAEHDHGPGATSAPHRWHAAPLLAGPLSVGQLAQEVINPARRDDLVGQFVEASATDVETALASASAFALEWQATAPSRRVGALLRAADLFEAHAIELMTLAIREAGKSLPNAIAELREAVDFLRYYAAQVDGAGHLPALGPVCCISPWNFPLAIFTGQVAAALAAGNVVLAKPAEQTPLIAHRAVQLLHEAGVPRAALQFLPGPGEVVGAALTADQRVKGVIFTGSTEVARLINRTLARRSADGQEEVVLIAETGGQNAMIVDSSALPEQVVQDAIASAFDSAGQRCSALRVLFLQEEIADKTLAMLKGAMRELAVGSPDRLATDIGPVIDAEAQQNLLTHISRLKGTALDYFSLDLPASVTTAGTFVPPTVLEIRSLDELTQEVFGPVLHVVRYQRAELPRLIAQINASGYGLTLGVHSRIDETIDYISGHAHVGNIYVNRNIVGAVVGVQPFGGENKSGTGPKAGGPLYLKRLRKSAPAAARPPQERQPAAVPADASDALDALAAWAGLHGHEGIASLAGQYGRDTTLGQVTVLPGPTGERNTLALLPRGAVVCAAGTVPGLLNQLAAALATGNLALLLPASGALLPADLPAAVRRRIKPIASLAGAESEFQIALAEGMLAGGLATELATRDGALASVIGTDGDSAIPLWRLLAERALCVNTTAAGGNASLMTLAV